MLVPNSKYPPPPFHPRRPLHLAAALCKYPEIIDLLLDDGAEVDPKNNFLSTPLSTACQANNPYAASRLIAKGVQWFLFKQYSLAICTVLHTALPHVCRHFSLVILNILAIMIIKLHLSEASLNINSLGRKRRLLIENLHLKVNEQNALHVL